MKKQESEQLYDICCAYCEYAKWNDTEDEIFCKKKNKPTEPTAKCRAFCYDLLKRKPQSLIFPNLEFPII